MDQLKLIESKTVLAKLCAPPKNWKKRKNFASNGDGCQGFGDENQNGCKMCTVNPKLGYEKMCLNSQAEQIFV